MWFPAAHTCPAHLFLNRDYRTHAASTKSVNAHVWFPAGSNSVSSRLCLMSASADQLYMSRVHFYFLVLDL